VTGASRVRAVQCDSALKRKDMGQAPQWGCLEAVTPRDRSQSRKDRQGAMAPEEALTGVKATDREGGFRWQRAEPWI
jgi:hypothetical protein